MPRFFSLFPLFFLHLAPLLIHPLLLHKVPVGVGEAGVVGQGSQPLLLQDGCCGVTLVPGQAVDYPRVICKQMGKEISTTIQFYFLSLKGKNRVENEEGSANQIPTSPHWN